MNNPDNLEPWQRVAAELGTSRRHKNGMLFAMDHHGPYVDAEAACREIAELRAEVERLRDDNRNMDSRIRGNHD